MLFTCTETSKDQIEIRAELTDLLKKAAENPPPKTKVINFYMDCIIYIHDTCTFIHVTCITVCVFCIFRNVMYM